MKKFFESASKQSWFDNTLFVITADHTGPAEQPKYQSNIGIFEIPVLFYQHNSELKGRSELVTQQCDIFPSIMDYLNYDNPFTAFGNSVFDSATNHFAVNFLSDNYQLVRKDYLLQFDGEKTTGLFYFSSDSLLKKNILYLRPEIVNENSLLLKSFIQQFNHAMIHNGLMTN